MTSIATRQDLNAALAGLVLRPGVVWTQLARALPLAELLHHPRALRAKGPMLNPCRLRSSALAALALATAVLATGTISGVTEADAAVAAQEAFSAEDLRGILTYDKMVGHLWRVATRRPDVTLSVAPYRAKATGRLIPVIRVGHGPRKVFITAMQHGNEYRVSNAAVAIAEKLSRPRHAWMRSALTVVIMPRVNVDGFDHTLPGEPWRGLPWRWNVDPTAVGARPGTLGDTVAPFAVTGVGYNVNRYHPAGLENPYAPTTPNPVPEALAVRSVFDQVQPSIMLDMHEQPSAVVDVEGRPVDVAVDWTTPSLGVAPAVLAQEKRIAYAAYLANPRKRTALYSFPSDHPGQAWNRYGLLGVPTVLVEFRGLDCWIEADGGLLRCTGGGDPNNRSATRLATKTVFSILKSIADGSVDLIDPALADQYILPYETPAWPTGTEDDH